MSVGSDYRLVERVYGNGQIRYVLEVGGDGNWIFSAQNYNGGLSTLKEAKKTLAKIRASKDSYTVVSERVVE